MGIVAAVFFPSILALFLRFFQTMDNIANLGMLNVEYGSTVQLYFEFLENLNFLPDLSETFWISDSNLKNKYFFSTKNIVEEEMEGGFMLATQPLGSLLFFVKNFLK